MPNHASLSRSFAARPPRSIVIAQLAFIGDMVFTTPLLEALVERWPAAEIAVVGRAAALEVLAGDPRVTSLLAYDKAGADRGVRGLARVAGSVRERRPELFFGVSRSARHEPARAAFRRRRCGSGSPAGARVLAYTHLVPRDDAGRNFPARPLALLEPLVGPVPPRPLRLVVDDGRRRAARERLVEAGWRDEPLLAVAPGAHYATKRWPVKRYAALLALARERGGFRPALYGGPAEAPLLDALRAACPDALDRRDAGVGGLVAELTHAAAFVGNDSGPTHIARALGVPAIALHGPTDPDALRDGRPYHALALGLPCQPCSASGDPRCPLAHHACLAALDEATVWAELSRLARATPA